MIIYDSTGDVVLDIEVDDTSVRYKAIKGENSLTLKFSLAEHIEIPLGAYAVFKNEKYSLMQPEDFVMHHRRSFEYSVVMYSEDAKSKRYKFVNPVDGRLKFSLTAKPKEHLQMFVDNMNMRDSGWSVGECPDHVEIVLSYNHTYCYDALVQQADAQELDFWFEGKKVNIGKLELNKNNPLPLSYGGDGEGLKPDIKRNNYSEALPIEVLYVQGTEVNINPDKYRVHDKPASELHLPLSYTIGYDGTHFDDEDGFDSSKARYYITDFLGRAIRRAGKDAVYYSEDSLDCTEIEPTKEETVASVVEVDVEDHFYDILFDSAVDYSKYVIEGEKATIVFQSEMLAGKEFDLATDTNGNLICKKEEDGKWRVEIVPQQLDGITMPDKEKGFIPVGGENGDKFKVFGVQLPDEYVAEAEMNMLKYAVKHFYANEDVQYTIAGELDEIYAKKNWVNIEGRLNLGNYVSFTDKSFQEEPLLIRIIGIKEYVNKPHSPILEISNAAVAGTLMGSINRMENQEAYTEKIVKDSRQFTKRTFADIRRAMKMLEDAVGEGFDPSLKPVTIQTMMMLVGDERLQFAFVEEVGSDVRANRNDYFDSETKTFKFASGILKHYTIGVNEIRSSFNQQYRYWTLPELESAVLDDPAAEYYVYAFVDKEGDTGEFRLETEPIDLEIEGEEDDGKYHLLMGLLLSERDGSRDYLPLYGFTQVQPGQITTDVIRSADGECYFDLARNEIGGVIKFKAGSYGELNIGSQNMLRNSGFTGDYLSEPLADEEVMEASKELYSDPLDHWTQSGTVSVISLDRAVSGKAVRIEGVLSKIAQELYYPTIEGEEYVLSFKAVSMSATSVSVIQMTCGGVAELVSIEAEEKRHVIKIKAVSTSKDFTVELFNNVSCVIYDLQLERGTIATAWGNSAFDNNSDRMYYQSLKYLQNALKGSTTQAGGLILSELIRLGDTSNQTGFVEKAGANGYHVDDNSPAFWAGGSMEQAINLIAAYKDNPNAELTEEQLAMMAKFVVTHGGRAILNNVIVRGSVYATDGIFSGFVKTRITEVNSETQMKYLTTSPWYGNPYIDIQKAGGYIKVTSSLYYPIALWGTRYATDIQQVDSIRSMVGSKCTVVNATDDEIYITGDTGRDGTYFSARVEPGEAMYFECVAIADEEGYEQIYWEVVTRAKVKSTF